MRTLLKFPSLGDAQACSTMQVPSWRWVPAWQELLPWAVLEKVWRKDGDEGGQQEGGERYIWSKHRL